MSSSFTGFTADLTIGNFYNKLVCTTCNPIAILGNTEENSSSSGNGNSSDSSSSGSDSSSSGSSNESESEQNSTNTPSNTNAATDESNKSSNSENNSNITADKNSISGEKTSKNFGIAVFKEDKMIGELSTLETISHLLMDNDIYSFMISVKNPISSDSYIDLSLSQFKNTKIDVDIINGSPYISVELFISGKILTLDENSNYTDDTVLESVEKAVNSYLEELIYSYLYKTSKEFRADIDGFGKYALKSFITNEEWKNFDWHSKYKDSFFKVTINTDIESSVLLTNS